MPNLEFGLCNELVSITVFTLTCILELGLNIKQFGEKNITVLLSHTNI